MAQRPQRHTRCLLLHPGDQIHSAEAQIKCTSEIGPRDRLVAVVYTGTAHAFTCVFLLAVAVGNDDGSDTDSDDFDILAQHGRKGKKGKVGVTTATYPREPLALLRFLVLINVLRPVIKRVKGRTWDQITRNLLAALRPMHTL